MFNLSGCYLVYLGNPKIMIQVCCNVRKCNIPGLHIFHTNCRDSPDHCGKRTVPDTLPASGTLVRIDPRNGITVIAPRGQDSAHTLHPIHSVSRIRGISKKSYCKDIKLPKGKYCFDNGICPLPWFDGSHSVIAEDGHSSMHAPQSTHLPASITAISSTVIAS